MPAHSYVGGWEHFVGGGVAVFDCDGDWLPEIYAAGGEGPAVLFANRTGTPGMAPAFELATPEALAFEDVTGAFPLDFDSDGIMDLAILRVGANRLLRGGPDCTFEDVTEARGLRAGMRWTTAFSATWEPGVRLPTLAVGNYVDRSDPEGPFEACDVNELHRPEGEAYTAPILLEPGYCALSMLFSDWDRRGRQDLRISNDRHYYVVGGFEELWRIVPEVARYGEADGWRRVSLWGMGIASRDITGDGRPEVYLTSMGDQVLQYHVGPGPVWLDAPWSQGASATSPYAGDDGRPSTGWHVEFGDVDNDGLDDLFVAKGNVDQMPDMAMADPDNLLMQQPDGTFVEAGLKAGLADPRRGRGASVVDLNLDGLLDVVVAHRRAPLTVHRNVTQVGGTWLALSVGQAGVNTAMVGGFIEVRAGGRTAVREITVGGGHAGGQAGFHHFGLGAATEAEIRLIAPDGTASPWAPVAVNRHSRAMRAGETSPPLVRIETLGF